MAIYKCSVCDTEYNEDKEGKKWDELTDDWNCHVCESGRSFWKIVDAAPDPDVSDGEPKDTSGSPDDFKRLSDDLEIHYRYPRDGRYGPTDHRAHADKKIRSLLG